MICCVNGVVCKYQMIATSGASGAHEKGWLKVTLSTTLIKLYRLCYIESFL